MSAAKRPDLLLVTAIWACSACGPIVKRAGFAERPTTVRRGFPLGPFDGRVEDSSTGKPIGGALVQATWLFERGVGNSTSYATRVQLAKTDPDGRYRIPRLRALPGGLSTRLARFGLQVYQRGYLSYRSDVQFPSVHPRVDFTQYANTVRLRRWQPQLSHAEHLLFSGGNGAFREVMRWERANASRELDRLSAPAAVSEATSASDSQSDQSEAMSTLEQPRLEQAARLLSADDVRRVTSFSGHFDQRPLRDPGDASSSVHLRALGRPERFDVALRLWALVESEVKAKYEALRESLPETADSDNVGDRAFTSEQGEIRGICFIVGKAIALLTCGRAQCASPDQLLDLARVVEQRLTEQATATPPPEELLPLEEMSE